MIAFIIFVFGLIIGSFLNVCILRIPVAESVVLPPSHCPSCGMPIKPYDNIPVVSWLVLAGRCRKCKARISAMYPMVELGTGLLFLACYLVFGIKAEALKWAIFAALLIVLTITDLRERILPDKVNFVGFGLGLLLSLFTRPVDGTALWLANHLFTYPPPEAALSFADALIGAGVASGLLWLVAEGYFRARGREGMGLGDVKMMAMAGAFLGLQRALLTILLGSLLGSLIGIAVIAIGRKGRDFELPFGTFLGAGAMLVVFFGSPALDWYRAFTHV
ncbi:MAG TPA: prepilin peptidase [Rugosimonospora sp.]|nr:prepilin peptidase [Rugosimonospora sp.]